jgi:HK97 family phage portal protein
VNLLDSIARLFSREKKAGPAASPGMLSRLTPNGLPPARGTRELLRAYRTQPWFRAAAGLIAREVAAVEWELSRKGKKGSPLESHPFLDLLAKPNPEMNGAEFREVLQVWRDSKGEGFILVERGANGVPVQLWPVPPHWIVQTATPETPFFRGSFGGWQKWIPREDVIWIRELDPENPYARGIGVGEALADELDTDEFAAKRTKSYFYNNASPEIIVSALGMSSEQATAAKQKWEAEYRGFWNSFRTFWTGSKIEVTRLDTTFKDMDLVAIRGVLRDTVLQVYGIPPEKLGILENSNRSTIDSADYLFAKSILVPRLRNWRGVWAGVLAQFPSAEGLVYDFKNPVPEDREFTFKVMQARPSAFTDNEVRKLVGHDPATGKDEFPEPAAFPAFPKLAVDPEFVKSLPPRRRKQITEGDVPNVLDALRPDRLTAELDPVFLAKIEEWGKAVLEELGQAARFDLLNPLIVPFVKLQGGDRIRDMVDATTRETLRQELDEGIKAGESIDDIELRVEGVFDVADDARAENIARTETLRASNWATHEAQRVSGVVDTRKWVATPDGRTRQTHRELNGQETAIDDPFYVDGKTAMYPGAFGDPAEDCQCRCTTVAVISDDLGDEPPEDDGKRYLPHAKAVRPGATEADLLACWKAYDEALSPWDEEAKAALRRGFRKQREDVLKALRATS